MPLLLLSLFLTIATAAGIALSLRQCRHVRAHRATVPAGFAGRISAGEHAKAADYTCARQSLEIVSQVWGLLVTLGWLFAGISLLAGLVARPGLGPILSGALLIAVLSLCSALLDLPMAVLRTFRVEARFGFNRMTAGLFLRDQAKGIALNLILTFPLMLGLLWLTGTMSGLWWLWAWAGFLVVGAAMMAVYPVWIAPLFNKFEPLGEGAVSARVTALLGKAGYRANGLFVMDGSRRSSHANAYFTGFGRSKRIVFFDTLLEKLSVDEVEAVLAHELGHFHHRDILRAMARLALVSLAVFFWLGVAIKEPWFTVWLGLPQQDAVAVVVAMICMEPLGLVAAPLMNALSWRAEWRADAYAVTLTGGGVHLASALVKLSRDSASTLTPDPLYARFHYSHPPLPLRLARLPGADGRTAH